MKRKGLIVAVLVVCLLLTGCGKGKTSEASDNSATTPTEVKENINLSNIQSKIEALGVTVEKNEASYELVGAKDGFKLLSSGKAIEIYQFDKNSDAYKKAEKNQKLEVSALDYDFDAVVKNGYAYTIESGFPQYDAVVSLLNQLQ